MKVGILTIHKSEVNFGACLQCYALWRYISDKGHECEIIDLLRPVNKKYIRSKKIAEKNKKKQKTLLQKGELILHDIFSKGRLQIIENSHFREFNDSISYSQTYRCIDELYDTPPEYDIYIAGSDQIWNPFMPFVNEPYFLTFVPKGKRKISYASSFAIKELPKDVWSNYKGWLKDFHSISVREKSGVDIVANEFEMDAITVLDPTMLLTKDDWERLLAIPSSCDNYLLVYTLHYNSEIIEKACSIAEKNDLKLKVIVSDTTKTIIPPQGVEIICDAGPKEWLGFIRNASYIVTDSFHGSVFSIIFEKDFLTVCTNKTVSERLNTLFESFNLFDNYINLSDLGSLAIPKCNELQLCEIRETLSRLRAESQKFLINALS